MFTDEEIYNLDINNINGNSFYRADMDAVLLCA